MIQNLFLLGFALVWMVVFGLVVKRSFKLFYNKVKLTPDDAKFEDAIPGFIALATRQIVLLFILFAICITSWTFATHYWLQDKTAYQNVNEKKQIEEIKKHKDASQESLDKNKKDQYQKSYKEPHKEALDGFDRAMEIEAKKILDQTSTTQDSN